MSTETTPSMTAPLRALPAKWREIAGKVVDPGHATASRLCADELERALAALPAEPAAGGEAVLAYGYYHWHEEDQDYELYPATGPLNTGPLNCKTCIPVAIVRADSLLTALPAPRVDEARVEVRAVAVPDEPDAHQVWFVRGGQSFAIGNHLENREQADAYAAMFRAALSPAPGGEGQS